MTGSHDIYEIRPGDHLYAIMREHYGDGKFSEKRDELLAAILKANPHITDADMIFAGTCLALPGLDRAAPVDAIAEPTEAQKITNQTVCRTVMNVSRPGRDMLRGLQAFDASVALPDYASVAIDTSSGIYGGLGKLAQEARKTYEEIAKDLQFKQALMQQGKLAKSSYYGHRGAKLTSPDKRYSVIRTKLGSAHPPTAKVMRISQDAQRMTNSLNKSVRFADTLAQRARIAGKGFAVLNAGIGVARYSGTDNARERSVIVMETAGSIAAGAATSMAVTAALVSNPVGWGVIIGVAAISMAASYLGGQAGEIAGEAIHDSFGSKDQDFLQALFD
jgi:hypothetical protein